MEIHQVLHVIFMKKDNYVHLENFFWPHPTLLTKVSWETLFDSYQCTAVLLPKKGARVKLLAESTSCCEYSILIRIFNFRNLKKHHF